MSKLLRQSWGLSRPPDVPFEINLRSPQAEGLVLWMPFGGGDPGSHRHVDRVRGLTFTEGGTPVWTLNSEGWSLLFDRSNSEYLEIDQPAVITTPSTFMCRFNSDLGTSAQALIFVGDKDVGQNYWTLEINRQYGNRYVYAEAMTPAGPAYAISTTLFSLNTWNHAAAVFPSSTLRAALLNAGSKGTNTTDRSPAGADRTSIGRWGRLSPLAYMSGRIKDARIYNVAKTDAEIYQIYADPWDLAKPIRRLWQGMAPSAPPPTIIPIAMHHYRSARL